MKTINLHIKNNKYGAKKVYAVIEENRVTGFKTLDLAQRYANEAHPAAAVVTFDSVHEYKVFKDLFARQRAGEISELSRQVVFELLPNQYETSCNERGKIVRKLRERKVIYTADFVYHDGGRLVVVDAKSKATRTRDYIIRRKLMLYIHNIKIVEM